MKKKIGLSICILALVLVVCQRFFCAPSHFIRMPVTFTPAGIPVVSAIIEGKTYLLEFDLGSKFQISLSKNVLDLVADKKPQGTVHWRDAKGNFYEAPSYLIPHVKIEDFALTDMIVKQEESAYRANTTLWNDDQGKKNTPSLGGVGRPLLEKTNLLLDFRNATMIACNSKQQLAKAGFFVDEMVRIPFKEGKKGIIVEAETDVGILRLALDTGTTITLVRATRFHNQECLIDARGFSVFTTKKFSIGANDFGRKNLFLYDIAPELQEIDGLLGMDFLENHVVYIDYKDKVVYLYADPTHQEQKPTFLRFQN